jgi:hypothetical protein
MPGASVEPLVEDSSAVARLLKAADPEMEPWSGSSCCFSSW